MSHSDDKKDLIYVPSMLQKYIENFQDPQIEQELSQESLPMLIKFICKVLDRENRHPSDFFPDGIKTKTKRDF